MSGDVRSFEHDGTIMIYTVSGAATGASFVLVHGIGMGRRVFTELAEKLAPQGRVYAIDLPGFGDSPEPASALSMSASGDFLAEFIRSIPNTKPTLVGHSMGTQVVVEAVARHPELSDTIVLIAPTVNAGERRAHTQMLRMLQDLAGESLRVLVVGAMQYLKTGPLWFLRKLRIMLDHDVEHTYPRVRARTLVLRGAHDRVCPRDWVRLVASLVPDAIMEEIPDRGHEAMISTPEPAATMIVEHALTRR